MGACYSVTLKIFHFENKINQQKAFEILRKFVTSERANFSLEEYDPATLDSLDGCIRICLAGHNLNYLQEEA